ncbi:unnamed protein product [Linum trigynum]|uniref:Uncharacterized protein n=1 Tax=Linum trigynum TaxID=586398 RepID=A0AAV2DIW1_9ROSI
MVTAYWIHGFGNLGSGTSWASDSGRTADCRRERIAMRRNENWWEGEEDPGGRLRRGGMMRSSAGEEESSGIRCDVCFKSLSVVDGKWTGASF